MIWQKEEIDYNPLPISCFGEWVSVEDHLPNNGWEVVCWFDYGIDVCQFRRGPQSEPLFLGRTTEGKWMELANVPTYWILVEPPPSMDEKDD